MIHVLRAIGRGDWAGAGQIIAQERWNKLNPLQRAIWWGTFLGQFMGLILMLRGAWRLRRQPALAAALLGAIGYVLWIPGPIAYQRFRVPVLSLIVALIGVSASPRGAPSASAARSVAWQATGLPRQASTPCALASLVGKDCLLPGQMGCAIIGHVQRSVFTSSVATSLVPHSDGQS